MLKLRRASNGSLLTLGKGLHTGGEGTIYSVREDTTRVAKIYKDNSIERAVKLIAMLLNPPTDPAHEPKHVSFAWPIDRILDEYGTCLGFLMPYVEPLHNSPLSKLINPKARRKLARGITWEFLLRTATNMASVVGALHERGYVIGDLNESNVLVSDTALVTLVDCDSMQVPTVSGAKFRCVVGNAEYTPAELQDVNFAEVERQPYHDAFGLAVLIFQLLMEGRHPFSGTWLGQGDSPTLERRIAAGDWPYEFTTYSRPGPNALLLSMLAPPLQQLMRECFVAGHRFPEHRPSAKQWLDALQNAEKNLAACSANQQHRYSNHLGSCPWCQRVAVGIPDPFPPLAPPTHRISSKSTFSRARVLAVHGCKAQTGATTTAVSLAVCLADAGFKTLLVDMSPEAAATRWLGLNAHQSGPSIYDVLVTDSPSLDQVVRADVRPNLSFIPSSGELYATDIELVYLDFRELRLKRFLDKLVQDYDFILIDCKAWLGGFLSVNAFTAADGVIVALQCEYFALEGMQQLLNTIRLVRDRLNPQIMLFGVVLTMYDPRTTLGKEVVREISEHFPKEKFDTIIPRNVRLAEALNLRKDILLLDPRSMGAIAYRQLAEEVIVRTEKTWGDNHS
jgi:cellulose biosynthesis protein BcsQ